MKPRQIVITVFLFVFILSHRPVCLHAEALSTTTDATGSITTETPAVLEAAPGIREEPAILPTEQIDPAADAQQDIKPADANNYTDEDENEDAGIADPLAPLNKAMFHVNDKLYFWALKPVAQGYSSVVPDYFRTGFSNAYDNLKAPARMINNFLQFRFTAAGNEFIRFLVNTTVGVAGLKDIARDVLDIKKQEADFGQTLGHYGIGHGFYIVWPVFGPSSLRDTVGFVGDRLMYPLTYVSGSDLPIEATVGIGTHEKVNDTSFKIGDYESFKNAALNPYAAMRDAFVQYRKKKIEESYPLFKRKPD